MSNLEKINSSHFESIDELIKTCKMWINEDDYDAYYRWFDFGAMQDLINYIDKLKEYKYMYKDLCK